MALSALPFKPSYTALENLRQKIHKYITTTSVNLSLPIRPQNLFTDLTPYLDGAIGILSNSTFFLYDDNAPWAVRVMEVKSEVLAAVDRVDIKVDKVKTDVAELKTDVAEIKMEMKSFGERQDRLESQLDDVRTDVDDVRTAINNGMAIQLNSLRKWLDDLIQPVSASVQIKDRQRYTVAADFPTTV